MGCTIDQERYSAPIPWIGLYITAASLACSIAMLVDTVQGVLHRNVSLPCKLFSLNATSLTLLAIATKLPVDLSTPMPRVQEQLTKLSGTALICVSMGHFMPSIVAMEDSEVILNVVPLAILVITIFVNICIQMGTGVIHAFIPEHIITLCFTLIFLLITCSSALTIPTMKRLLKQQSELKCREVPHERPHDEPVMSTVDMLKKDVKKYSIMDLTSNPQYVLSRSYLGTATGLLCSFQAVILIQAFFRTIKPGSVPVCTNQSSSDYRWSIPFVFFSQLFGVMWGSNAPFYRLLLVLLARAMSRINVDDPTTRPQESNSERRPGRLKIQRFWIQNFVEWKDRPLLFDIRSRRCQRLIHASKNLILEFTRCLHIAVVVFSKYAGLSSDLERSRERQRECAPLETSFRCFSRVLDKFFTMLFSLSRTDSLGEESVDSAAAMTDLRTFVLHLQGEDRLVDSIMHFCDVNTERWILKGRHSSAESLTNLLEKVSTVSQSFIGEAPSNSTDHVREPPNCWALPLVILTSIALAIPCAQGTRIKPLLRNGVSEGLTYVRYVDKNLDSLGLAKVREAADIVWVGVDLYHQWCDLDIAALSREETDPNNVIQRLEEKGRSYSVEFESMVNGRENVESSLRWPPRALARYSMHIICTAILRNYSNFGSDDADRLFEWLHLLISDMLGACLTNLPQALYTQCYNSAIEGKEDRVREAACLLGEAENILRALRTESNQDIVINQCKYIDHWSSFMPNWWTLPPISHGNASDPAV